MRNFCEKKGAFRGERAFFDENFSRKDQKFLARNGLADRLRAEVRHESGGDADRAVWLLTLL